MKPVEEMTIEECEREVKQHNPDIDTLCYTMDSADNAIRAAGGVWEKTYEYDRWLACCVKIVEGKCWHDVEVEITDNPALDLWRLAVKVWRAKKGGD